MRKTDGIRRTKTVLTARLLFRNWLNRLLAHIHDEHKEVNYVHITGITKIGRILTHIINQG